MGSPTEPFGVWGEPFFALVAGDLNCGKSTDIAYGCPTWLHVGQPGGNKPAIGEVGYKPFVVPAQTLDDVIVVLDAVPRLKATGNWPYPGVAIDDLTLLSKNTEAILASARDDKGNLLFPKEGNGVFRYWDAIKDRITLLKLKARFLAGVNIVACCHVALPFQDEKEGWIKGGPEMSIRKQVRTLPGIADILLRVTQPPRAGAATGLVIGGPKVEVDPNATPPFWPNLYHCDPHDPNYYERDRHGVFKPISPMNFGEGLREAGYYMPRAPGLEWQEDVVEAIAYEIAANGGKWAPVLEAWRAKLLNAKAVNLDHRHIRWALRDGYGRSEFRRLKRSVLNF